MFDENAVAKIIDFGAIATKAIDHKDMRRAGGFASPEVELATTKEVDPFADDTWEVAFLFLHMLLGDETWTDAKDSKAKAMYEKKSQNDRAKACEDIDWNFTPEFCKVLSEIFVEQGSRKDLGWFAGQVANPSLKVFKDCAADKKDKRSTLRRDLAVVDVEDAGDELVVRAVLS